MPIWKMSLCDSKDALAESTTRSFSFEIASYFLYLKSATCAKNIAYVPFEFLYNMC